MGILGVKPLDPSLGWCRGVEQLLSHITVPVWVPGRAGSGAGGSSLEQELHCPVLGQGDGAVALQPPKLGQHKHLCRRQSLRIPFPARFRQTKIATAATKPENLVTNQTSHSANGPGQLIHGGDSSWPLLSCAASCSHNSVPCWNPWDGAAAGPCCGSVLGWL